MAFLDNVGLSHFWSKVKTYVTNAVANKVDKVSGKSLSTNDFTDTYKTLVDNAMPKSGGTFTGNVSGLYFTGTWLRTTASSDLNAAASKIAVLDSDGWMYYRTLAELKSDLAVPAAGLTEVPVLTDATINEICV